MVLRSQGARLYPDLHLAQLYLVLLASQVVLVFQVFLIHMLTPAPLGLVLLAYQVVLNKEANLVCLKNSPFVLSV